MEGLVADTHAVVWYLLHSKRLSSLALSAMEEVANKGYPVYVSPISMMEVIYLVEKGKLPTIAFSKLYDAMVNHDSALELAPFDLAVIRSVAEISREAFPDMPDRIIAATARMLGLPLITRDRAVSSVGVQTIW